MALPKKPQDMNIDELRMLLEVRKLELKIQFQDLRHTLGIGGRILRAVQKSGIIETIIQSIQPKDKDSEPSSRSDSQSEI